jgi:hypothetical protein
MTRQFARIAFAVSVAASVAATCDARVPQGQDAYVRATATTPANWYEVRGGNWQLQNDLLADIFAGFPAEAARHAYPAIARPLADYTVQYRGQMKEGRRVVSLSGVCSVLGKSADELRAEFLIVFDGGNCFFHATYDLSLRRFTEFSFNGVA